jgi:hypothetical protein
VHVLLERISLLALLPKYQTTHTEEAREMTRYDRAKALPTSMPLVQVLLTLPLSLHACLVQKYKY